MKRKGKMPEKVRSVKFMGSQLECEIVLDQSQLSEGPTTRSKRRKSTRRRQKTWPQEPPPVTKQSVLTRCSPKFAHDACRALLPTHRQALAALGLGELAKMTLNGLEQPDLTCWLMDRTNPKSMTIDISENKKIVITPWKVKTVLGVPLGGDPLQLPDQDIMSDALSDLAIELDLPPKSDITASRLIEEIKKRPKDRTMVRYFIMVIINKMLLPSTGLYIRPKDAWIGSDLDKLARINWSKAVFDALCDSLLYIDNLKVPKDSFTVNRCETPRIQLYTKHLVEDISQEDRVTDPSGNYVFGNLPMNGILGSSYSHPNYGKEKEPRGDNSGTPFADELISAIEISFPSMFDTVYPHLSGLQDEHKQHVLDALGEYDRQCHVPKRL
uniref:Uncharacterized protein n=1 Tax=Oryza glumipatula TaxID=40148 RepID=A0A0E0A1C0_9ORYZ